MKSEDYEKFTAMILTIGEVFGDKLGDKGVAEFWKQLSRFSIGAVLAAADQIIITRKYKSFPTIADFIEIVDPSSNIETRIARGFHKASRMVVIRGSYETVEFNDPTIHHVIDSLGGWVAFCERLPDTGSVDYEWFAKDFGKAYKAMAHVIEEDVPKLPGRLEIQNRLDGYLSEDGVLTLPSGRKERPLWLPENRRKYSKRIENGKRVSIPGNL